MLLRIDPEPLADRAPAAWLAGRLRFAGPVGNWIPGGFSDCLPPGLPVGSPVMSSCGAHAHETPPRANRSAPPSDTSQTDLSSLGMSQSPPCRPDADRCRPPIEA